MNGPAAAVAATTASDHRSQCKPLRIFRIPLANLCGVGGAGGVAGAVGANHHASQSYHMRSASVKQRTVSVGNSGINSMPHGTKIGGSVSNANIGGIAAPATLGSIVQQPIATGANIVTNTNRTTIDEELGGGQPTLSPTDANVVTTILDATDRAAIGSKRDKLNELNTFNYGCAEPLFTSL